MEMMNKEMTQEIRKNAEVTETVGEVESLEQQEMNRFAEAGDSEMALREQQEMDEGGKLGYSSSYYEHRMATALENGNKIAYENARRDWAKAKVREST